MKNYLVYTIYMLLLGAIACACSDDIDIKRNYEFQVIHLPVPKEVAINETVEVRCQLLRDGYYDGAKYHLRYFQPDGEGELRLEDGIAFTPNDLYPLEKETFRLYYTSRSEDQQTIDVYFFDNFGNEAMLSFSFTSKGSSGEEGKDDGEDEQEGGNEDGEDNEENESGNGNEETEDGEQENNGKEDEPNGTDEPDGTEIKEAITYKFNLKLA